MRSCTKSVSWLLLERYQLGEVSAAERVQVEAHLTDCPGCQADLDALTLDDRPLPALPGVTRGRPRWTWAFAGLAACGLVLTLVAVLWAPWRSATEGDIPPARIQVKGGELALTLIRDRVGVTDENPTRYEDGDRFRIELTCPPGAQPWDVVVFQAGRAHFPYAAAGPIACGNRVGLPGAFSLSGPGPVTVCAMVGDAMPRRADVVAMRFEALDDWSVCSTLANQE